MTSCPACDSPVADIRPGVTSFHCGSRYFKGEFMRPPELDRSLSCRTITELKCRVHSLEVARSNAESLAELRAVEISKLRNTLSAFNREDQQRRYFRRALLDAFPPVPPDIADLIQSIPARLL